MAAWTFDPSGTSASTCGSRPRAAHRPVLDGCDAVASIILYDPPGRSGVWYGGTGFGLARSAAVRRDADARRSDPTLLRPYSGRTFQRHQYLSAMRCPQRLFLYGV